MRIDDELPEWARSQVRVVQQKVESLNDKLDIYEESDGSQKVAALESALGIWAEIENIYIRFESFLRVSGMVEAAELLQHEISECRSRGLQIQEAESIKSVNILFIDTETTGLGSDDQPISVGAVLCEVDLATGHILQEIASYYGLREPSCEISPDALRMHGLSKVKLRGKEFDMLALVSLFGVAELIVAHNAKFDRRMLSFLKPDQYRWGCSCWDVDWPDQIGGRSLDAICSHFCIHRPATHNALSDTRAMMDALQQQQLNGSPHLKSLLLRHLPPS